jgi:hypothetical protein
VIFNFNHNPEQWIRAYGLALFMASAPHFSGMRDNLFGAVAA